jgi:NADP-dependent 3-hydroxy acid dehydrogenase YdfG
VNLTAVFLVTRAALPLLLRAETPTIVAMSSVAGRQAYANCSAYCASKHGLEGLLAVMRAELRARNVRVLSVAAGATSTPFWDAQPGEWDRTRMMAPGEIAGLVVAAMHAPPSAAVEEILVRPSRGDL